jgi:hypothetical protein
MEVTTQIVNLNPASAFGVIRSPYIIRKGISWEDPQENIFELNLKDSKISEISRFGKLDIQSINQEDNFPEMQFLDLIRENKNEFEKLIQSRLNYLKSLRNLKDNWISGPNEVPSLVAIDNSKYILSTFYNIYSDHFANLLFIPKIIMGPIPSGGISIECQLNERISIFFNVFNYGKLDEYIDLDGHYHEIVEQGSLDQIRFPISI